MQKMLRFPRKLTKSLFSLALALLLGGAAYTQIQSVTTLQNMSFGAFSQGSNGGKVMLSASGLRTSSGSVVLLGLGISFYQAIFEIGAPAGTVISVLNGPDITLSGSNGGTMTLHLDAPSPASPFISQVNPPAKTTVIIGGTLTVGSAATTPPGTYSGSFSVTFNNE